MAEVMVKYWHIVQDCTCKCYIDGSPSNDNLDYLTAGEIKPDLVERQSDTSAAQEIDYTGNERFMNPDIIQMLRL